jgi:signal transduction histidine kinase
MFRSIRWRLVLSYVFLILLTLGVVGAVILKLVSDYVERREREYLTANAEAVAQQAQPHLWPVVDQSELQELAETFSFLGNARVRILNAERQVLVDSELGAGQDAFAWLLLPHRAFFELEYDLPELFPIRLPAGRRWAVPFSWKEQLRLFERLSPERGQPLVVWRQGTWPSGFSLHIVEGPDQLQELGIAAAAVPRSDQVIDVPIGKPNTPLGYVEISHGPDVASEALRTTRQAFLLAAAGALLLAIVVGLLVSRGLTAPLRELSRVTGRMSSGDLSTRAPVRSKDEIGQLAGQFNHMAGRLEASFAELEAERDTLRRFMGDASHELRTPITALKSFNDLLQGAAADDPAAQAEFLAESQIQIGRLEWITRNLLDLSRLDAGLATLELADHDVADLLEASASGFIRRAQEKGIALSIRFPSPPITLHCDRARIELALSNLMDNALKFTPAGGQIELGAEASGSANDHAARENAVRLWVQDAGPGIDPDDAPHIFQRFYRGRKVKEGPPGYDEGAGLGLAIVHSIVHAHGGRISVDTERDAGTRFTLELPQHQDRNP